MPYQGEPDWLKKEAAKQQERDNAAGPSEGPVVDAPASQTSSKSTGVALSDVLSEMDSSTPAAGGGEFLPKDVSLSDILREEQGMAAYGERRARSAVRDVPTYLNSDELAKYKEGQPADYLRFGPGPLGIGLRLLQKSLGPESMTPAEAGKGPAEGPPEPVAGPFDALTYGLGAPKLAEKIAFTAFTPLAEMGTEALSHIAPTAGPIAGPVLSLAASILPFLMGGKGAPRSVVSPADFAHEAAPQEQLALPSPSINVTPGGVAFPPGGAPGARTAAEDVMTALERGQMPNRAVPPERLALPAPPDFISTVGGDLLGPVDTGRMLERMGPAGPGGLVYEPALGVGSRDLASEVAAASARAKGLPAKEPPTGTPPEWIEPATPSNEPPGPVNPLETRPMEGQPIESGGGVPAAPASPVVTKAAKVSKAAKPKHSLTSVLRELTPQVGDEVKTPQGVGKVEEQLPTSELVVRVDGQDKVVSPHQAEVVVPKGAKQPLLSLELRGEAPSRPLTSPESLALDKKLTEHLPSTKEEVLNQQREALYQAGPSAPRQGPLSSIEHLNPQQAGEAIARFRGQGLETQAIQRPSPGGITVVAFKERTPEIEHALDLYKRYEESGGDVMSLTPDEHRVLGKAFGIPPEKINTFVDEAAQHLKDFVAANRDRVVRALGGRDSGLSNRELGDKFIKSGRPLAPPKAAAPTRSAVSNTEQYMAVRTLADETGFTSRMLEDGSIEVRKPITGEKYTFANASEAEKFLRTSSPMTIEDLSKSHDLSGPPLISEDKDPGYNANRILGPHFDNEQGALRTESIWKGVVDAIHRLRSYFPAEERVRRAVPNSKVISAVDARQTEIEDGIFNRLSSPWSRELERMALDDSGQSIKDAFDVAVTSYDQLIARGVSDAAAMEQVTKAAPPALRQWWIYRESLWQTSSNYRQAMGLPPLKRVKGPYAPHVTDTEHAAVIGDMQRADGILSDLTAGVGRFDQPKVFRTFREGEQAGFRYVNPFDAMLLRDLRDMKVIATGKFVRKLDGVAVHATREEALAASPVNQAVPLSGFPGGTKWVTSQAEHQFLVQNLKGKYQEGNFGMTMINAVFRNYNFMNPLIHPVKNILDMYLTSGGSLAKLSRYGYEYAAQTNPESIKEFLSLVPHSQHAMSVHDMMASAGYGKDLTRRFAKIIQLAKNPTPWSWRWSATRMDPMMRYARWMQYKEAGMSSQEAANNVVNDMIRYGTRSQLVDGLKRLPGFFFMPWKFGVARALGKNIIDHPFRTAFIVGTFDFLRSVNYRKRGRWIPSPIDYIEGPVAQAVRNPSVGSVLYAGFSALIPGAAQAMGAGELIYKTGKTLVSGGSVNDMFSAVGDIFSGKDADSQRLRNIFWGVSALYDLYEEGNALLRATTPEEQRKHAANIFFSAVIAERSQLSTPPPSVVEQFLPEGWVEKSQKVQDAERLQSAIKMYQDIKDIKRKAIGGVNDRSGKTTEDLQMESLYGQLKGAR